MNMPRKKTKFQSEVRDRRKKIAALYLNKVDQADIAEKLGISQPTVSRDIKALNEEWRIESIKDVKEHISRELAELERMELEAASLFQAAKRDKQEKLAVNWIETRLKIKDRRANLLGLNGSQKIDMRSENKNENINVIVETSEDIRNDILSRLVRRTPKE
jgi:DNA-binding MarR family transcriptional regulator